MGLSKAPQALAKLVICSILGCGIDMCNSNLMKQNYEYIDSHFGELLDTFIHILWTLMSDMEIPNIKVVISLYFSEGSNIQYPIWLKIKWNSMTMPHVS